MKKEFVITIDKKIYEANCTPYDLVLRSQEGVFFNDEGEELDNPYKALQAVEQDSEVIPTLYYIEEGTIFFTEEEDDTSKTWRVLKPTLLGERILCEEQVEDM